MGRESSPYCAHLQLAWLRAEALSLPNVAETSGGQGRYRARGRFFVPVALICPPRNRCPAHPGSHSPCAVPSADQTSQEESMILVGLHGIVKSYGGRTCSQRLDLTIGDEARIGLVGANGAGKSTLAAHPRRHWKTRTLGEVARKRGLRVAFLPQHIPGDERTPMDRGAHRRGPTSPRSRRNSPPASGAGQARRSPQTWAASSTSSLARSSCSRASRRSAAPGRGRGAQPDARARPARLATSRSPCSALSGGQRKLVALAACMLAAPRAAAARRAGDAPRSAASRATRAPRA